MEVYVLLGHMMYEGYLILGVYHTVSDAEFHREHYINENGENAFDDYSIERRVIGARGQYNYGQFDVRAA